MSPPSRIHISHSSSSSKLLYFTLYPLIALFVIITLIALLDIERGFSHPSSTSNLKPPSYRPPSDSNDAVIYRGKPWVTPLTASRSVIYQTAFASCEVHDVWTEDHSAIQEDWLWVEEIDHVNVIVVDSEDNFYFFHQKKYGLESISFATVGGFIDVVRDETGFEACRRETMEEMGMTSPLHLQSLTSSTPYDPASDPSWIPLGRYRTASNRGGGFLTSYLLKDAKHIPDEFLSQVGYEGLGTGSGVVDGKENGNADGEKQVVVKMSRAEARKTLLAGGFQEVKWTASLSLALHHLNT